MNFEFIKNLSRDDICKLIDLIEGMPQSLNRYIKINISKPEFYKSILNSNTILLNKNNSIDKYLDIKISVVTFNTLTSYCHFNTILYILVCCAKPI